MPAKNAPYFLNTIVLILGFATLIFVVNDHLETIRNLNGATLKKADANRNKINGLKGSTTVLYQKVEEIHKRIDELKKSAQSDRQDIKRTLNSLMEKKADNGSKPIDGKKYYSTK